MPAVLVLFPDHFRYLEKLFIVQWRIFQRMVSAHRTPDLILTQHVDFIAHVQQWLNPIEIQLIQLFHKTDHALKVTPDLLLLRFIEAQLREAGQFFYRGVIDFHRTNIADSFDPPEGSRLRLKNDGLWPLADLKSDTRNDPA